jgi:hypothetical protein
VAFSGGDIETAKIVYRFRSLREPGDDHHWVEQAERPRLNPICSALLLLFQLGARSISRLSSVSCQWPMG